MIILVQIMTLLIMVWEVMNTLFINIWNVGDREPVQSCPALDVMVWEVPNIIILKPIMTLFIMVWEVMNTLFINIWKLHLNPYCNVNVNMVKYYQVW